MLSSRTTRADLAKPEKPVDLTTIVREGAVRNQLSRLNMLQAQLENVMAEFEDRLALVFLPDTSKSQIEEDKAEKEPVQCELATQLSVNVRKVEQALSTVERWLDMLDL